MDAVIGTCSICGGPVMVPAVWYGIEPPIPTCRNCGAVREQTYGPIIPMRPNLTRISSTIFPPILDER